MSRIPSLIQAELIGVPFYLHNKIKEAQNSQEQRIIVLELGIWKGYLIHCSMGNVFNDPIIAAWGERLKTLLDYPGAQWNSSHRLEILEDEINYGIELLDSSIRSPVLKQLLDFLIAARDGKICEYYQQISKEKAGLIIEFSSESKPRTNNQGGCLWGNRKR